MRHSILTRAALSKILHQNFTIDVVILFRWVYLGLKMVIRDKFTHQCWNFDAISTEGVLGLGVLGLGVLGLGVLGLGVLGLSVLGLGVLGFTP